MASLKFKRLRPEAEIPAYATSGAAGLDITLCCTGPMRILPSERRLLPTGLAVEIPEGYELQCRPRSGLAIKRGLTVLNTPGTIDSDYRGEIMVVMINHSDAPQWLAPGDRIAQLVLAETPKLEIVEVAELSDTERGEGGFGSTGR